MAGLINLGAGLSAAGNAVSTFAGNAGLAQQKADLESQQAVLANQLATQRESFGRQEAGQIAATAAEKQQTFETGLENTRQGGANTRSAAEIAGQAARTAAEQAGANSRDAADIAAAAAKTTAEQGGANTRSAAEIAAGAARTAAEQAGANDRSAATIAGEAARTEMTVNAEPESVRVAKFLETATPAQKQAFTQGELAKAGVPSWVMGPDQGAGGPGSNVDGSSVPANNVPGAPAKGASNAPSGYNEDALKDVPPSVAANVKAMVEGRLVPPTSFAMSKPYWQAMISLGTQYDPSFDQTTWSSRVATRKDFTAGQSAKTVTAINTALGHAGVVSDSFDQLNNGSIPAVNEGLNWLDKNLGGDKVTNAQEAVSALASEARKVFAGSGGGNLTELENWEKNFPINGSPTQQKGAMKEFVGLLDSRLEAMSDQYNRGMQKTDDPLNLLEPHARQVYESLTGRQPQNATGFQLGKSPADQGTQSSKPIAAPTKGAVVNGYTFQGGDPSDAKNWSQPQAPTSDQP